METQVHIEDFLEYYPKIFRQALFLTLNHWHNAEDLTQETYLQVIKKSGLYHPERGTMYSWLKRLLLTTYWKRFCRKIDRIPTEKYYGAQLESLAEAFKPWSNTSGQPKIGDFQYGNRHVGKRQEGEVYLWSDFIHPEKIKNLLPLHLNDAKLREFGDLTEIMFRVKLLIGLGFKPNEIAQMDNVPVATVKSRARRANQKLRLGYST